MHKSAKITNLIRRDIYEKYTKKLQEYARKNTTVRGVKYPTYKSLAIEYKVHINTIKKIIKRGKHGDFDLHLSCRDDYRCYGRAKTKHEKVYKGLQKKKDRDKIIRYEKQHAGELGHTDIHKLKNIRGENPKKKRYQIALEDDASRITYSETIRNKRSCTVVGFMRRALLWFKKKGITFKAILSDNGLEFTTHIKGARSEHKFEKFLTQEGIKHKYTKVRRPQTNGKIERWWQILENELFQKHTFTSWKQYQRACNDWMTHYNFKRPHGGIQKMTPWEKYQFTLTRKTK